MSDIDRETARRALADAAQNPAAFTTKQLKMLMDAAEGSDRSLGETPSGGMFGLGATGGEKLAEEIKPRGSADDVIAARAANPKAFDAFQLSPKMNTARPAEEVAKELERSSATHFSGGSPEAKQSASGRKDLYAPPELIAPPDPDPFFPALDKARSNLPNFAGGKVEHFLEPPIQQFRRDMAPYLGPDVAAMGISSPQYREYADQQWKQVVDQAKTDGRSVVRTAYKDAQTLGDKASKYAAMGIGQAASAATGVDEFATGGMLGRAASALAPGGYDENRKNAERLTEINPMAHTVGQMIGASQGAGRLVGSAAEAALPAASSILGGTARGAAAAGAVGATGTASNAISEGRSPGAGELALGAGLAAPFGAAGGALRTHLLRTTPLGQVEKTGMGRTELLRGIAPTDKANAISNQATAEMGMPGREVDMLARDVEKPLTKAGRALSETTKADLGAIQEGYYNATENVRKPTTPMLEEAMKLHEAGTYPTGETLPAHEPRNAFLKKFIGKSADAEIVQAADGKALSPRIFPSSIDLTPEEAARRGIDVERLMAPLASTGQAPGEYVVRMTPKQLNPKDTEGIASLMHEYVDSGQESKSALASLDRAVHEVRDQFPAAGPIKPGVHQATIDTGAGTIDLKDWSAFQHEASQRTEGVKRTLGMAGLPETKIPETLTKNQASPAFAAAQAYKTPGRHPEADAATRRLAELAGLGGKMEDIAGMRGLREMQGQQSGLSRKGLLKGAELRLDPFLNLYGPAAASALPNAGKRLSPQQLPPQLDPATLEQMKLLMGPFNF